MFPGRPRAPKDSPPKEEEEAFETPTMSFESFLTYDAPAVKKKKKPSSSSSSSHSRPSHSTSSSHRTRTPPPPPAPSSSSKASKANGTQSTKRPHSGSSSAAATPEKRKRVRTAAETTRRSFYIISILFNFSYVAINWYLIETIQIIFFKCES